MSRRGTGRPAGRQPAATASPTAARLAAWDELEVEVEKLVTGGDGMARPEGIPLFIPRSAPGDRLRVRIVERRPDYGRAEIVEILAPGRGRRPPPCPHFEHCGGCQLQHLEDDLQTRLKAEATLETLARLGGVELAAPPEVLTAGHWAYRLRTQLHTRRVAAAGEGPDGAGTVEVGYFARGSHDLVPVDVCPILVPELERLLPELPERLRDETPRRLDLAAGGEGTAVTASPVVGELPQGAVELSFRLSGDDSPYTFGYDARCFFQAHRRLLVDLVERAVGPWKGEIACDLYAGVGLFTMPLCRRYDRVLAVEGDAIAARYARLNARRNRIINLEPTLQAVETWIGALPGGIDRLVVDPPRSGLSAPVREAILERPPARLTYVSCDAATLARDLRSLLAAYTLESVVLLDMFPQSGHIETVVQLVRGR